MTSMPYCAALPVPTIIATGVARPKAQGQDITSTETAELNANSNPLSAIIHTTAVIIAIRITIGTKIPLTLSAIRAIGAFVLPASSTRRIICESVVSSPTLVAVKVKLPFLFTVAQMTVSSTDLSTGILSPVIADWSIYPRPSLITPSHGMLSPGRSRSACRCF